MFAFADGHERFSIHEHVKRVHPSLTRFLKCLGCVAIYFLVGMVFYTSVVESWSFTDAVYFAMVTLLTVGYGVLTPSSQGSRFFTMLYILFGICVAAAALVEVADMIVEERALANKRRRAQAVAQASDTMLSPNKPSSQAEGAKRPATQMLADSASGEQRHDVFSCCSSATQAATEWIDQRLDEASWNKAVFWSASKLLAFVLFTGLVVMGIEHEQGWTLVDSFYFIVVTGTTVGYGDLAPTRSFTKWLNFFFLPVCVIFCGSQISTLGEQLFGSGEEKDSKLSSLLAEELTLEALLKMDTDGDDQVTEFEFLKFMLTKSEMVEADILDKLHGQFLRADVDGSGVLTREDLLSIRQRGNDNTTLNSMRESAELRHSANPMHFKPQLV